MSTSLSRLRIGRLFGIPIEVHWTFGFLVALVVLVDGPHGGGRAILAGLAWILAIFGCVLIHELAHCVVAAREGVIVDDVLLLPIGGVSQMRSIPSVPGQELAMAAAGPLTSFGLAVGFGLLALLTGSHLWPPTLFAGSWLVRLAWLNVVLGAFNLLPALPMDGGRILRAGLAMHESRRAATIQAAKVARFLALLMIAVGILWDLWLVIIGLFVLMGAGAEEADATTTDGDSPRR
jgi:Zn-dependent protease